MSRFDDVYDEAFELYRKNRYYDAAVLFEKARSIAKEYGMKPEAAEAGVWAAIAWSLSAHPQRALALLMDIRRYEDQDLEILLRWFARVLSFAISAYYSPELDKLQTKLDDLRQFQEEYPSLPIADIYQSSGLLLLLQGKWQEALTEYELAWIEYDDENQWGYFKYGKAEKAALCNLNLGNLEAAQDWCDVLEETETEVPNSRVIWWTLQANIALYQGQWQQAEEYAIQAEKKAEFIQPPHQGLAIRVRTLLLQPEYGDPAHPSHPARFRLKQRTYGKPNVHARYNRVLLLADYRLACLRYALGVAPVDDNWYQQPQQLPTALPSGLDLSELRQRVKLAQRAIKRAMQQAQYLDDCFQCHWRQQEVTQRQKRLDQLLL